MSNLYLVLEGIAYSVNTQTNERAIDSFDRSEYQVKAATLDLNSWLGKNNSDWVLVLAPSAQNALNFAAYYDKNFNREYILRRKYGELKQYRSILLFDAEGYRPKFVSDLLDRIEAEQLEDLHALDLTGEYSPWIFNWRKTWELPAVNELSEQP